MPPVTRGNLGVSQCLAKRGVGRGAEYRTFLASGNAQHTVKVVRDQHEPRIGRPGIKSVVTPVTGHEACFLVSEQVMHREVTCPVVEIHLLRQRLRECRAVRLAKHAQEIDQVGVVIEPAVSLLGVEMQLGVRCGRIPEKFQIRMAATLVQVAVGVIGKLPVDVLGIQRIQLRVMMELG